MVGVKKNIANLEKYRDGSLERQGGKQIGCMMEYLREDYSTFVLFWEG